MERQGRNIILRSMRCGGLQEGFLERLRGIQPDLCVTAAYGNILPRAFLDIPRCGTLNIHPSLLPRWRGAAPVPRAIEVQNDAHLMCCTVAAECICWSWHDMAESGFKCAHTEGVSYLFAMLTVDEHVCPSGQRILTSA
jgi:Formyl transferase